MVPVHSYRDHSWIHPNQGEPPTKEAQILDINAKVARVKDIPSQSQVYPILVQMCKKGRVWFLYGDRKGQKRNKEKS